MLENKRTDADTGGNINAIKASKADANQLVASTEADIFKLQIDIDNFSKRVDQRTVDAPCSGRIVRLLRVGAGAMVNAGDVLAVIAPHTQDRAAEINIRDWDAPLVSVGRPVSSSNCRVGRLCDSSAGAHSNRYVCRRGQRHRCHRRWKKSLSSNCRAGQKEKSSIANKQADPWRIDDFPQTRSASDRMGAAQ